MNWRDHLTAAERKRIAEIEAVRAKAEGLQTEYRAIAERCRKRAKRARTKQAGENVRETTGADATDSVGLN